jgi:hypothetical protein
MSLQEKFQITQPPTKEDGDEGWVMAHEVHRKHGYKVHNNSDSGEYAAVKMNQTPPGMDIGNMLHYPEFSTNMPLMISGQSDVSGDVNPAAFEHGFSYVPMKGTDDQYTGEHTDLFYGEAVDEEGHVGFVERNNYMDRA